MAKKTGPKKPAAKKKPKRRTVADVPKRKVDPKSLAEQLKKPFSLTDCKRVVALAEMWADARLAKVAAQERRKTIEDKYHKATNVQEQKTHALALCQLKDQIDRYSENLKASVSDLIKLVLEDLGDGATVWAAAAANSTENGEGGEGGEEVEDPAQLKLVGGGGDPGDSDAKGGD